MNSEEYLTEVGKILELDSLSNVDSTLLNDEVVRLYFDERVHPDMIESLREKIAHCCDVEQFNSHIVDIVRKPFARFGVFSA